jgi:uncharacterized protein YqhQ
MRGAHMSAIAVRRTGGLHAIFTQAEPVSGSLQRPISKIPFLRGFHALGFAGIGHAGAFLLCGGHRKV